MAGNTGVFCLETGAESSQLAATGIGAGFLPAFCPGKPYSRYVLTLQELFSTYKRWLLSPRLIHHRQLAFSRQCGVLEG